jgi:transcriptional regulator with XRE-family HTH domain
MMVQTASVTDDKRIAPGPATQWIMRNLRGYREQRGLSHSELSERLTGVGRPIPPQGLRRIERGDRRVDVDDVMALARVLGVTPIMLVFPLGREQIVELLPGQVRPTWAAVKWFIGRGPFPTDDGERQPWQGVPPADPMHLYTIHDGLLADWQRETRRVLVLQQLPADEADEGQRGALLQAAQDRVRDLEQQISERRGTLRESGFLPPPLPPQLAHLDPEVHPDDDLA